MIVHLAGIAQSRGTKGVGLLGASRCLALLDSRWYGSKKPVSPPRTLLAEPDVGVESGKNPEGENSSGLENDLTASGLTHR